MNMVALTNWTAQEMYMLMAEQKMYMVVKIPESIKEKAAKSAETMEFKPTGRKEKIAGYDAEEYVGNSEGRRTEIWVTKGMGQFMMAQQGRRKEPSAWEKFLRQGEFFALRVVQRKNEGGPEEFHMEVQKVEKGSQPDSLFVPPADYKRFEMPSMGGMLKGLIPGGGAGE
jgi:hypothetical protein